jgi:hypothetical protein
MVTEYGIVSSGVNYIGSRRIRQFHRGSITYGHRVWDSFIGGQLHRVTEDKTVSSGVNCMAYRVTEDKTVS